MPLYEAVGTLGGFRDNEKRQRVAWSRWLEWGTDTYALRRMFR
jgi:hypothetical protein